MAPPSAEGLGFLNIKVWGVKHGSGLEKGERVCCGPAFHCGAASNHLSPHNLPASSLLFSGLILVLLLFNSSPFFSFPFTNQH